jgi:hypothetical protein
MNKLKWSRGRTASYRERTNAIKCKAAGEVCDRGIFRYYRKSNIDVKEVHAYTFYQVFPPESQTTPGGPVGGTAAKI